MADPADVMMGWFRAIEDGNVDRALSFCGEDVEWVAPSGVMKGHKPCAYFFGSFVEGFPDHRFQVGRVITSGSTVVVEGAYVGTHSGTFRTPAGEIPPTGREVSLPFASVTDVEGDQIAKLRVYWDQMDFMSQLGLPQPPSA
jgi:predicted ester cyclase